MSETATQSTVVPKQVPSQNNYMREKIAADQPSYQEKVDRYEKNLRARINSRAALYTRILKGDINAKDQLNEMIENSADLDPVAGRIEARRLKSLFISRNPTQEAKTLFVEIETVRLENLYEALAQHKLEYGITLHYAENDPRFTPEIMKLLERNQIDYKTLASNVMQNLLRGNDLLHGVLQTGAQRRLSHFKQPRKPVQSLDHTLVG